jgi:hypothetical protein
MVAPVTVRGRDLRALAAMVSEDRPDVPAEGLPPPLLADLMAEIRCDALSLDGWDAERQMWWFSQEIPSGDAAIEWDALAQVHWEHYWDCPACSYPARSGDRRSVIKNSDFYSARQWRRPQQTPAGGEIVRGLIR